MRCSHRAATAIVLLFGSAVACDKQSPIDPSSVGAVPSGPFRMSGRVLNFVTNVGTSGVSVAFARLGDNPRSEWTTVTDNAGTYTLVLPEVGLYGAKVDGAGAGLMAVTGSGYR